MDKLLVIPRAWHNKDQKLDTKSCPLSDTMSAGRPCLEKTCWINCLANFGVLSIVLEGMKMACLVRWQTMTRIEVKSSEGESSPM